LRYEDNAFGKHRSRLLGSAIILPHRLSVNKDHKLLRKSKLISITIDMDNSVVNVEGHQEGYEMDREK
jgi:hypothetical protein